MGAALLQLFEHPALRVRAKALAAQSALALNPPKAVAESAGEGGATGLPDVAGPTANDGFVVITAKVSRLSPTKVAAASGAAGTAGHSSCSHAGGHAAYLAWFVSVHAASPPEGLFSGCFSCFTGGDTKQPAHARSPGEAAATVTDVQRKAVLRRVFRSGLKFARFKHLPLNMDHP